MQRDWRRRGILPNQSVRGICKRSSKGRWTFTFEGYKLLWLINRLAKFGFDLYDATLLAGILIDDMHKAMGRDIGRFEQGDGYCRYSLIFPKDKETFRPQSDLYRTNDPMNDTGPAPAMFTTVDVERLSFEFARSLGGLAQGKVDEMRAWVLETDPSAKALFDEVDKVAPFPSEKGSDG
ncbi:hypothetical protein VK792_07805 [Mesobacterium sp. TK19101]|uniref:Uncharacterized protein n=1 Tax=Mesobacterium hydrothermale TaxID=3111907 RepID=A0ABU6HFE0_9RHOB|nr:hypothetical protein [Mesobacterium sp. TK19101]MEC3861184.1 hypothetical protein [Mesobacterium sp. TK19101]